MGQLILSVLSVRLTVAAQVSHPFRSLRALMIGGGYNSLIHKAFYLPYNFPIFQTPLVRRGSVYHLVDGPLVALNLTRVQVRRLAVAERIDDADEGIRVLLGLEVLACTEAFRLVLGKIALHRVLEQYNAVGNIVGMDVLKLARKQRGMGQGAASSEQIVEMRRGR